MIVTLKNTDYNDKEITHTGIPREQTHKLYGVTNPINSL